MRMDHERISGLLAGLTDVELPKGVEPRVIDAAQEKLGVVFPDSYREFLGRFGGGAVSFQEFFGLTGPEHLNMIRATERLREHGFPHALLPLSQDGYGNYDCIEIRTTSPATYQIVQWRHEDSSTEFLSNSLQQWLENVLTMIHDVDSGRV
jgi:antitoxin YobK